MRARRESIEHWFDYGLHPETRTVLLADDTDRDNPDGVNDQMANRFLKAIHWLQQSNDPIRVILRSVGGDSFAGSAIFDGIRNSPCHVTCDVYGSAFSMGGVILQAADTRRMAANALLMLHNGTFTVEDSPKSLENWSVTARKLQEQMYAILAERTGKKVRYWEKKLLSDYILTADEALAEGLIDEIIQPPARE